MQKDCKKCGLPFEQYRTTQNLCPECQYKKVIATPKERRKTLAHKGKVTHQWLEIDRPKWFRNHPPTHEGYYQCYLQIDPKCPRFMRQNQTTLDHVKSRTRDPSKRRKQQNFRPACYFCNQLKGSLSIRQVKRKYPQSLIARDSMIA